MYHLTRMIEVDSLVRQGILYPRWFPDFGLGHGYPIFNFFPPFAYLLTELPALLLGDIPTAIQVSMAASVVVSGWGFYLLARELEASRLAAVATAGFYVYFPYHLQDVYTRGGMPELWAMAWLPWLVWAQLRATRQPGAGWIGTAGLLGAMEVGTHNILAVFILPLSLAISLSYSRLKRSTMQAAAACSGLALLLSTGYWLPAVVEAPLTHVKQLAGDWLPFHTYPLSQLVDPTLLTPYGSEIYKMTALEAAIVAGLLIALGWRAARSRHRLPLAGLMGLMLLIVFGLTRWSVPLWTHLPLLGYIQFPWRLLILVGFLAGTMLAVAGSWHYWAWPGLGAIAIVMAVTTLAQVPDNRFATTPPLDGRALETQEYGSALDGVAIESEYQPQTSDPDLVRSAQGRRLPDDSTLAPPVSVQLIASLPTATHVQVTAAEPSRIRLRQLYFPGWQAELDGHAWPIRPATQAGLIEADVPSGNHRLDVSYTGTVLEGIAGIVSGLTLFGVVAWIIRRRKLALAGVLLGAAYVAVLATRPPTEEAALHPMSWSPSPAQTLVAAGAPAVTERGIEVDLVWLYNTPHETRFDFVLHDSAGRDALRIPAGEAATLRYEYLATNELLRRRYTLTAPVEVPAGNYTLALETPSSLLDLGTVRLPHASPPDHHLGTVFQGSAELSGYSVHPVVVRPGLQTRDAVSRTDTVLAPGDFALVSLLWRSLRGIDQNYVTFVHLIDRGGKAWAIHDNEPNATLQATSSWIPGQTIPDRYLLHMPDEAPPGLYKLEVGFYHVHQSGFEYLTLPNGGNSVVFGSVKVRSRVQPAPARPLASWTEPIALEGWHQARQADGLALTFDWRATGEVTRDYTLFVHLSDGDGKVVSQADSPPQAGWYPTNLWEGGDPIADTHVLSPPTPGHYRLSIGWYCPDTGQRLPMTDGKDELDLGEIDAG